MPPRQHASSRAPGTPRSRKTPASHRTPGIKTKIPAKWSIDNIVKGLKKELNITFEPDPWQPHAIQRILQGYDSIVCAGTGYGKSLIFEGLAALGGKSKCVVIICPLKALERDQATQAQEKGLNAVAVNEDTEKTPELWTRVRKDAQVVYISPEMALSESFRKIWTDSSFRKRLTAVIIDEAHCVDEWGGDEFRPEYRQLNELRGYTGYEIPFVACTATAQTSTFDVLWDTLGYGNRPFWGVDVGADRANLLFITRPLENPSTPVLDLLDLLPSVLNTDTKLEDIDKGIIYVDSETSCRDICQALRKCLPAHLRAAVQPFSSVNSERSKVECWKRFAEGKIRILVATDAAGMGCNVPDIKFSVIIGCPKSFSVVAQRWGRAGRNRAIHGVCLLLVPHWCFAPVVGPVNPAIARVQAKSITEPKDNAVKRAKVDSTLLDFINIATDDCAHSFLRTAFRPSTQLAIRNSLTNNASKRTGERADASDFEMTWTILDLPGRQATAARCCHRCNPNLCDMFKAADRHDCRLSAFAADFIFPVVAPPAQPPRSSSQMSNTSQETSFKPPGNRYTLPKEAREAFRADMIRWRERRHLARGGGAYLSSQIGLPPAVLEKLVENCHRFLKFRIVDINLLQSVIRWDTASALDWEEVVDVVSAWRETLNVQRTPQSHRHSTKRLRSSRENTSGPTIPLRQPVFATSKAAHSTPASQTRSHGRTVDVFGPLGTIPPQRNLPASTIHTPPPPVTPSLPSASLRPQPTSFVPPHRSFQPHAPLSNPSTPTVYRPIKAVSAHLSGTPALSTPVAPPQAQGPSSIIPPHNLPHPSPYYRPHTYQSTPSTSTKYYRQ